MSIAPRQKKKEIWTFGGGKGGVGKSLICANVGIVLSQKGFKVLLVDADFGAANLHTYVGANFSEKSLGDFLLDKTENVNQVISETKISNLFLISGGEDYLRVSNPSPTQLKKLLHSMHELEYDYILIDLGAGTTAQTIDIFTQAKKPILVCVPEPAAVENTYRFIKYSFLRAFRTSVQNLEVKKFLDQYLLNRQNEVIYKPQELLQDIAKIDEQAAQVLKGFLHRFTPHLIMNMVRSNQDVRLGFSMCQISSKYFGIELDYVGFIESDEAMPALSRSRNPVLIADPFSKSSRGIRRIVDGLVGKGRT